MSSREENQRNTIIHLRKALWVHKDQLRDVNQELHQERIKTKRLEEELKEKTKMVVKAIALFLNDCETWKHKRKTATTLLVAPL